MLASQLDLPILPLTISNSGNLQPKGKIAIKPGTITLTFSPAIETPQFDEDSDPRKMIEEIKQVMEKTRSAIDSHL